MPPEEGYRPEQAELSELRQRVTRLEHEVQERGLREAEKDFHLLADTAPVMLWMAGVDSLCTFFNRPWLEFRGRTLEQELGNGWAEGVHPDDRQRCMNVYQERFAARHEFRMEYRLRRYDGEFCWIVDTGVPRMLGDGTFGGYIGSGIVITDNLQSRLERAAVPPLLTAREVEVLTLVAEGKSTKETAAILGISYKTADSHRARVMAKLDVHETASLVRLAIRMGLVKP